MLHPLSSPTYSSCIHIIILSLYRCSCNGHASQCSSDRCQCVHNTQGVRVSTVYIMVVILTVSIAHYSVKVVFRCTMTNRGGRATLLKHFLASYATATTTLAAVLTTALLIVILTTTISEEEECVMTVRITLVYAHNLLSA